MGSQMRADIKAAWSCYLRHRYCKYHARQVLGGQQNGCFAECVGTSPCYKSSQHCAPLNLSLTVPVCFRSLFDWPASIWQAVPTCLMKAPLAVFKLGSHTIRMQNLAYYWQKSTSRPQCTNTTVSMQYQYWYHSGATHTPDTTLM